MVRHITKKYIKRPINFIHFISKLTKFTSSPLNLFDSRDPSMRYFTLSSRQVLKFSGCNKTFHLLIIVHHVV